MTLKQLLCLFSFVGIAFNYTHAYDGGITIASHTPEELPNLGFTYYRETYSSPSQATCEVICHWLHEQQQNGQANTLNQEVLPFILMVMHKAGVQIEDQECRPTHQLGIAKHFSDFLSDKFATKTLPKKQAYSIDEKPFIEILERMVGNADADHSHDEITFYELTQAHRSGSYEQTLGAKAQTVRYMYGLCEMKRDLEEDHGTEFSPQLLEALSDDVYSIVLYKKRNPELHDHYTLQGWQSLISQWHRYRHDSNHTTRLSASTKSDISLSEFSQSLNASLSSSSLDEYPAFATICQRLVSSADSDNTSQDVGSDEDIYGPW